MNRHRGFTLIELLVVVVIIGIIAAAAIPNMLNARYKAKFAAFTSYHAEDVRNALDMFYTDEGRYPDNSEGGGTLLAPFLKTKQYLVRDYVTIEKQLDLQTDKGNYHSTSSGEYYHIACVTGPPGLLAAIGDNCIVMENGHTYSSTAPGGGGGGGGGGPPPPPPPPPPPAGGW